MSVFIPKGKTEYHMKFRIPVDDPNGQQIFRSCKTTSKRRATQIEMKEMMRLQSAWEQARHEKSITQIGGQTTMAETLKVQIGTFQAEYALWKTTAPENADGFGTIMLTPYIKGEVRFVLVRVEHEAWQSARYHSGMWAPERLELDRSEAQWITDKLYKRMISSTDEP